MIGPLTLVPLGGTSTCRYTISWLIRLTHTVYWHRVYPFRARSGHPLRDHFKAVRSQTISTSRPTKATSYGYGHPDTQFQTSSASDPLGELYACGTSCTHNELDVTQAGQARQTMYLCCCMIKRQRDQSWDCCVYCCELKVVRKESNACCDFMRGSYLVALV